MKHSVLVTGGCGYIGSIVVERLLEFGHDVVVIDNLRTGNSETVQTPYYFGCCGDAGPGMALRQAFENHTFDTIMHLAGETTVAESITNPGLYFRNNVMNTINLLDVMLEHGCKKIIFSSSAAVYGHPERLPICTYDRTEPISAYGESKLMIEKILRWYDLAYGLKSVIFRYFNVAGATKMRGECHSPEMHLIPSIMQVALGQKECLDISGSGMRDYIHVSDIAAAHIRVMDIPCQEIYNLGSGIGFTVEEIIKISENITGRRIQIRDRTVRVGDPEDLIAVPVFTLKHDIESIIKSAWDWHREHPKGYKSC